MIGAAYLAQEEVWDAYEVDAKFSAGYRIIIVSHDLHIAYADMQITLFLSEDIFRRPFPESASLCGRSRGRQSPALKRSGCSIVDGPIFNHEAAIANVHVQGDFLLAKSRLKRGLIGW